MSVRPIWEVPAAWQVADFISDFDRLTFGTLRDGFFTGNDETAASFVDAIEDSGHGGVIVGCDGTREMRQLVLRSGTCLVGTVLTYAAEQAQETVRIASANHVGGMQGYRRPHLERYRYVAQRLIEQTEELRNWWPVDSRDWNDQICGPTSK